MVTNPSCVPVHQIVRCRPECRAVIRELGDLSQSLVTVLDVPRFDTGIDRSLAHKARIVERCIEKGIDVDAVSEDSRSLRSDVIDALSLLRIGAV